MKIRTMVIEDYENAYKLWTNTIGNAFWKSSGLEERVDLNYYNMSLNHENK